MPLVICSIAVTALGLTTHRSLAQKAASIGKRDLLEPGYYANIGKPGRQTGWIGLYGINNKQAVLKPCAVNIGPRKPLANADGLGIDSGQKVTVNPGDSIIFAAKGIAQFKPGTVTTCLWHKDTEESTSLNFGASFTLGGRQYQLTESESKNAEGEKRDRISLRCGDRSQIVADIDSRFSVEPVWVGDLDGDGKPDIYVRNDFNNYLTRYELYLSSSARHGDFVGMAAMGEGRYLGRDNKND